MNLEEKNASSEVAKTDNVKATGEKAKAAALNFSQKQFGKVKGSHILIGVCALVVLVILCVIVSGGNGKEVAYPAIYTNSDGNLMLFPTNVKKEEKAIKLSSDSGDVEYANTTDKYVIFEKNDDLYLYNSSKKDDTTKILSDVISANFTDDDKYVYALNKDSELYIYNFKGEAQKVEKDVSSIKGIAKDKIVYVKDGKLMIRSLNPKKDDAEKITEEFSSVRVTEDGKKVFYINNDKELYSYTVSKKSSDKVAKDVTSFIVNEKGTKLYYISSESNDGKTERTIYLYDGKDGKKVASDVASLEDCDVDKEIVIYSKVKDSKYTLYYQKGTKDAVEIEDDMKSVSSVILYEGKAVYYINGDDEARYAKLGNSIKPVTIAEDLEDNYFHQYKNGVVFVADVDKKGLGTLYVANGAKAKKVDGDVSSRIKISNNGSKIYYFKDYSSGSGDLYVTSGGKGKKIESDVYSYTYVKDNLIYILKDMSSKGKADLYRYTGKSVKIAENVTSLESTPNYYDPTK